MAKEPMQNYVLGGKDHFAADREAAHRRLQVLPEWRTSACESRLFLGRTVRYLTAEAGIRQFLDIGPGLPSAGAAHEVAQAIAPETRVAYADNDPMVVAHARSLLNEGQGICVEGNLAEPQGILAEISGPDGLDLSQPVGLLMLADRGVVLVSDWRRDDPGPRPLPSQINFYGGVGRKPEQR